jgi:hypothetical protein
VFVGKRLLAVLTALGLIASVVGAASANEAASRHREKSRADVDVLTGSALARVPDSDEDLPKSKKNMKLVGKLELTELEDGITDVYYHRGYAYLGTWIPHCGAAGTHIVSLKKPKRPKAVAFAPTGEGAYVSEGVHVFHANTDSFEGDILLQDRETCPDQTEGRGGFDLYDVTNPKKPKPLVLGAGDTDANNPDDPTPLPFPNDYHSIMGWQQRGKAYAVGVDNFETLDVDIYDISDPTAPVLIAETGLEEWPDATVDGYGDLPLHHDMWVKRIDGDWRMLVSYWDLGYTLLDINDPSNPQFIDDFDFPSTDPIFPNLSPPEGNAHQAEWSTDGKFILASDEDFSPFRPIFQILTGPNAGEYQAGEFGWTVPILENFEDGVMNGPTVWGGRGCPPIEDDPATPEDESFPGDPPPPSPEEAGVELAEGEEAILVLTRGFCFFSEKVEVAQNAGYDAVIIGNHHAGAAEGGEDAFLCGSQGHEFEITASAVCVGHRTMHLIFNDEPEFEPIEDPEGADMPDIGTVGEAVSADPEFDGWGYLHLINANTLKRIDSFAVKQAKKEKWVGAFPLSSHEIESDPRRKLHLAYVSYYEAGARVFRFGRKIGLDPVGHFIDKDGADYWGVQPVPRGKRRPLLLFSDRHFGLYVLKYTGRQ